MAGRSTIVTAMMDLQLKHSRAEEYSEDPDIAAVVDFLSLESHNGSTRQGKPCLLTLLDGGDSS
jgi:hypothetical protein